MSRAWRPAARWSLRSSRSAFNPLAARLRLTRHSSAERSLRGDAFEMRALAPEQAPAAWATGSPATAGAAPSKALDGAGASDAAVANAPMTAARRQGRRWARDIETSPRVSSGLKDRIPPRRLCPLSDKSLHLEQESRSGRFCVIVLYDNAR